MARKRDRKKSGRMNWKVIFMILVAIGIVAGAIVYGKMKAHPRSSNIGFRP